MISLNEISSSVGLTPAAASSVARFCNVATLSGFCAARLFFSDASSFSERGQRLVQLKPADKNPIGCPHFERADVACAGVSRELALIHAFTIDATVIDQYAERLREKSTRGSAVVAQGAQMQVGIRN